jgi:hypothetical protein
MSGRSAGGCDSGPVGKDLLDPRHHPELVDHALQRRDLGFEASDVRLVLGRPLRKLLVLVAELVQLDGLTRQPDVVGQHPDQSEARSGGNPQGPTRRSGGDLELAEACPGVGHEDERIELSGHPFGRPLYQ